MVETITAPDDETVVFKLKFATLTFLPALADPYAYIYAKKKLDQDMHWYEKNIMGSGPFKLTEYQVGQSIKGERNPDYYHPGQPYLDGFVAIFAPKQSVRTDAIRADRAASGVPVVAALGAGSAGEGAWRQDQRAGERLELRQRGDPEPPEEAVRRRARAQGAVPGHRPVEGRAGLSKIAIIKTVGGIVFPGSPLAATKEELEQLIGYWPDIEKSRAEARRLLKEAGQENLTFRAPQPQRRPALQDRRHLAGRRMEQGRLQGDTESGSHGPMAGCHAQR